MAHVEMECFEKTDVEQKLEYIASMTDQFIAMVPHASAQMLRYLLRMVATEARLVAAGKSGREHRYEN